MLFVSSPGVNFDVLKSLAESRGFPFAMMNGNWQDSGGAGCDAILLCPHSKEDLTKEMITSFRAMNPDILLFGYCQTQDIRPVGELGLIWLQPSQLVAFLKLWNEKPAKSGGTRAKSAAEDAVWMNVRHDLGNHLGRIDAKVSKLMRANPSEESQNLLQGSLDEVSKIVTCLQKIDELMQRATVHVQDGVKKAS